MRRGVGRGVGSGEGGGGGVAGGGVGGGANGGAIALYSGQGQRGGGAALPGDFVDGVFFAEGVEHLLDEEGEAAALLGVAGVGGGEVVVEELEGGAVAGGGGGIVEGEDFPLEAGGGLFAF